MIRNFNLLFLLFAISMNGFSQQPLELQILQRGEATVLIQNADLESISGIETYSIEPQDQNTSMVYLNYKHYKKLRELNIPFVQTTPPSERYKAQMATHISEMHTWDSYPDYNLYLSMMQSFAENYPELCDVDTIGFSIDQRLILTLKISDYVDTDEAEPEVFYSSSMHGDELVGYVLSLRLADYLLSNYYTNAEVQQLVKGLEIYINPLANPDGTFSSGNHTVNGATRFNKNGVDLNRNYPDPDPDDGEHPDGNETQPENIAMMSFMNNRNFILSANFHGGAEVMNYPWDTWSRRHPDTDWFELICRAYADSAHLVDATYLTDLNNGVTNGYDWYSVAGGRQDYMTYFLHGREVTAELSGVKLPEASELPGYWEKNKSSLLNYLKQARFGFFGQVTNVYGRPLNAKVTILNHDTDNSWVFTQDSGFYYRMIKAGTYELKFESEGYQSKTIYPQTINDFEAVALNAVLDTSTNIESESAGEITLIPNPAKNYFTIAGKSSRKLTSLQVFSPDGKQRMNMNISGDEKIIPIQHLNPGFYFVVAESGANRFTAKLIVLE